MKDRLRHWGRLAVVDVTPLREVRGYRWLFAGQFFAQGGRQMTVVAVPVQIYQLTESTLAVGFLGLAQLVPLLLVSVVGGALADAVNRRKLLVFSQLTMAATAAGLLWNSLAAAPLIWPLFVLVAINAGVSAIDNPARHAIVPGLVGRRLLPSSLALNQILHNIAAASLPAVAGFLISTAGLPWTYGIEMVMFLISAVLIRHVPDVATVGGGRQFGFSSIAEGFRYLKDQRIIQATLLIDLNAMVFGMPTALFPAMGTETFGGDAFTVGLLYAAPGAGALLAALTSGWVPTVVRQGRATIIAVIVWGSAIAVFGLTAYLPLALVMLGVAGAADVVSAIYRGSIVQLTAPDELRGRMGGMHTAVVASGPRLGDLEAGVVAELTSTKFSVVSGGLACIVGALLIARWSPEFVHYRHEPSRQ